MTRTKLPEAKWKKPLRPIVDEIVPSYAMEAKTFEELVYRSMGEASVCWSELPKGVFDSSKALEIAKRIIAWHEREIAEVDE